MKWIARLLAIFMMFSCCACGKKMEITEPPITDAPPPTESYPPEETESPDSGTEEADGGNSYDHISFPLGFRRGINFGNLFDAPNEGEWGPMFDSRFAMTVANYGFDFARIPVQWTNHLSEDNIIDPDFLTRIDYAVNSMLALGVGAIINIHNFNDINNQPEIEKTKLFAVWEQLSEHYAGFPADKLCFEIMNEPGGLLTSELWNEYQNECIRIIRKTNPDRKIIVNAANSGSYNNICDLVLPKDDNLILSFDYYAPFTFTHQGPVWEQLGGGTDEVWQGTESEKRAVESVFRNIRAWSEATGIPVILSEFGVYKDADMTSRFAWTSFVRETAERCGFAWTYWEFFSHFGIYDVEESKMGELIGALIPAEVFEETNTLSGLPVVLLESTADTIGPGRYLRNIEIENEEWTGYEAYDTEDGTVIVELARPTEMARVYVPLDISDTGAGFSENTIELTVRNLGGSIDDLCINLDTVSYEKELLWLDGQALSENSEAIRKNADGSITIIMNIESLYAEFAGNLNSGIKLKVFIESVPSRPSDESGSLEFMGLVVY